MIVVYEQNEKSICVNFNTCTFDIYPYDWTLGKHIKTYMHLKKYIQTALGCHSLNGYISIPTAYIKVDGCYKRIRVDVNFTSYQQHCDIINTTAFIQNPNDTNCVISIYITLYKRSQSLEISYSQHSDILLDQFELILGTCSTTSTPTEELKDIG